MYEQNCKELPPGDALALFGGALAEIERLAPSVPHGAVAQSPIHEPNFAAQPHFAAICRRLLLPGSRVIGFEHLAALARLAKQGASCLLCLNHRSTLDVPTLYALIEDQADPTIFHQIVWIAGRKLDCDRGPTPFLANCFRRIVVTPKTELLALDDEAERREARRMNMRAYRAMRAQRRQGWVLALFPAGTRQRDGNACTAQAIEEVDSYLRRSDYLVLGHIEGCTLPATQDHDLAREAPRLDCVVYTFSPVLQTASWRGDAAIRYPTLDQREASRRAIMEDIAALATGAEDPVGSL